MQSVTTEKLLQLFPSDYFRGLSTFGALSEQSVSWLLEKGECLQMSAGDVLFRSGEDVSTFYVIISGRVSQFRDYDVNPILTRTFASGEQIGFAAMIALETRRNTAVSDESGYLLKLSADQFFEYHIDHPQEFGIFLLNLSREMARTIGIMSDLILASRAPSTDQ